MTQREILFRGLRTDGKGWVSGYLVANPDFTIARIFEWDEHNETILTHESLRMISVIPETVVQFIGLLDKNKQKIWEGDIVRWDDGSNGEYWRIAVVFYDDHQAMYSFRIIDCINCVIEKGFVFGGSFAYRGNFLLEKIGDIHTNPYIINP